MVNPFDTPLKIAGSPSGTDGSSNPFNSPLSPSRAPSKYKVDLSSVTGLSALAESKGFGTEAGKITDTTPKLSFLNRLGAGLGAFNPAEAILTGTEKGAVSGVGEYGMDIVRGLGSAITGTDYQEDRRTFKDVAEKFNIENGWAKFGVGFGGDILADPTTYFGGAIARGLGWTVKGATSVGLKTIGRVAPEVETGIRAVAEGVKDAAGRALVVGYKATEGAREDVLTFLSRKDKAQLAIAGSNLDRLGTGALSKEQQTELALSLAAKKRAEFELGQKIAQKSLDDYNALFPGATVRTTDEATKILSGLDDAMVARISEIRTAVEDIVAPLFKARNAAVAAGTIAKDTGALAKVDELNGVIDGLKEQAAKLRSERIVGDAPLPNATPLSESLGDAITPAEIAATRANIIAHEEERLWSVIDDISKKIENLKNKPVGDVGVKKLKTNGLGPRAMTPAEIAVYAERAIQKVVNETADREKLLQSVIDSRKIGKKLARGAVGSGDYSAIEAIAPVIARTMRETSSDPVVRKAMKEQLARVQNFAKDSEIDDPYTFYFPFIKKESVDKFLKTVEGTGVKVGSEAYRKEFRNILTNDQLELNPAKAYFSVESRQVSDNMTKAFLTKFVSNYGKPMSAFKDTDEALRAGYKAVKAKGRFGKEIGYVPVYDSMLLGNLITPEFQTVNMLAKATGFDAITSLFKRSVTGLFIPFHIRNFVSGMIQNFEVLGPAALNPKAIAAGQKLAWMQATKTKAPRGTMTVAGQEVSMQQVYKQFIDRFGSDSFYANDFETAISAGSQLKRAEPILSKSAARSTLGFEKENFLPLVGQDAIPMRAARAVGQYIEHQQKATAYMVGLSQGKSIKDSLKLAETAGFDYRSLTAFESQILRRIIPFYSFTRKNIELQLKTLGENPQRINQILAFFGNMGDKPDEEERQSLPKYIQNSIGVKMEDLPNGIKQYITGFGTPVEAFASLVNENPILYAISQSNPLIKAPVELGIGKDSFRQQDLKDVYDAKEYSAAPQFVKDMLGIHEVQKDVLQKQPNGKLKKVGERTVYMADPEKLLIARSLFSSRGFSWLDQIFDGDMEGFAKWLKIMTGVKVNQVDVELVDSLKERDQKRALEDLLIKAGEVSKFQNVYVPK